MSRNNPRPYKNNVTNRNRSKSGIKKDDKNRKDIDVTTRIRVDDSRLNDFESLDTSFLEGRKTQTVSKSKKDIENDKKIKLKENDVVFSRIILFKRFFFTLSIICIILLSLVFIINKLDLGNKIKNINLFSENKKTSTKTKEVKKDKEVKDTSVIDDNYLFVGDYYTEKFNFDSYDYHYVKSVEGNLKTSNVLDDMNNKIYKYNPSKVFLEIGSVDLNDGVSITKIINNMSDIIDLIKDNRPYASIYVESIYPINKSVNKFDKDKRIDNDIDNEKIKEINTKLSDLVKEKEINYIDVYSILEKDGSLNKDYTEDGVYLNDKGYKEVKKLIDKIIKD